MNLIRAVIVACLLCLPALSVRAASTVNLLVPTHREVIRGNITMKASASGTVSAVQFHITQSNTPTEYIYSATNVAGEWQYTWNSSRVVDDTYEVYATAVDASGFSYLSQFVTVTVGNETTSVPDEPDQNVNSNQNTNTPPPPPPVNTNTGTNGNTNSGTNTNTGTNGNVNAPGNANVNSSPGNTNNGLPDGDGDGLPDADEPPAGTDPGNPDSDGDGLTDGFESDQNLPPDRDGGYFPNPSSIPAAYVQYQNGLDNDRDGLDDGIEAVIGTSTSNPDTDGDGVIDGVEFTGGRNPNVAEPADFMADPGKLKLTDDDGGFPWTTSIIFVLIVALFGALGYAMSKRSA